MARSNLVGQVGGQTVRKSWPVARLTVSSLSRAAGRDSSSGVRAVTVRVAPYLDHLAVVDRENLVETLGWCRSGAVGQPGQGQAKYDGVAVDLHAFDRRAGAVGEQAAVPVEDLIARVAQPGP